GGLRLSTGMRSSGVVFRFSDRFLDPAPFFRSDRSVRKSGSQFLASCRNWQATEALTPTADRHRDRNAAHRECLESRSPPALAVGTMAPVFFQARFSGRQTTARPSVGRLPPAEARKSGVAAS